MKSSFRKSIVAMSLVLALGACGDTTPEQKTTAATATAAITTDKVSEQTALIPVTVENYNDAEAARNFRNWSALGGVNKLVHLKKLSPLGPDAPTIRMNLDTLYSVGVFKNNGNMTVTLPQSDQFQSVMVIDDESFNPLVVNGEGTYPIESDADYVFIAVRTYVADQNDQSTYEFAYTKQAGVVVTGADTSASAAYVMPNYNQTELEELTQVLIDDLTASGKAYLFFNNEEQIKSEEDRLHNIQSNASGWAGTVVDYSGESTFYKGSKVLSASDCMVMNSQVPNDKYFSSFTFYDQAGYILAKGDNYLSNTTWDLNKDGSLTVSMNCGADAINNIDTAGQDYQYISRHYGAGKAVIDGDIDLTQPTKK
jgi:hypothetical protein